MYVYMEITHVYDNLSQIYQTIRYALDASRSMSVYECVCMYNNNKHLT